MRERRRLEVEHRLVARAKSVHDPLRRLDGVELPRGNAVPEEDARERLRDHRLRARRPEGNGGMLPRRSAPEVLSCHEDGVGRGRPAGWHESRGAGLERQTREGVAAKPPVLLGDRRHEVQVLGGDDLIGVDVVSQDVDRAGDGHGKNSRGSVMRPVTAEAATV